MSILQELLDLNEAAESEKIEAYGVKGMKSTPWRKTFKNQAEYEKWLEKNEGDIEVQGTRKLEESGITEAAGKFKISWKGYPGNPKPEVVDDGYFGEMGFDEGDIKEIQALGVGEEWKSGSPIGDSVTVVRIAESIDQLDEKVFDEDKYTWYVWTQSKPSQSFDRRGGSKQLSKGMQFGLRPATSKAGTWRLIMKQKGPSIIFSIDDDTAKTVAKQALELI